jgi:predicted phage-related endonuclease
MVYYVDIDEYRKQLRERTELFTYRTLYKGKKFVYKKHERILTEEDIERIIDAYTSIKQKGILYKDSHYRANDQY